MTKVTNTDFLSGQMALVSAKYCAMRAAVFAYIRKHIGNETEAEDIMQETFTRLLEYRTPLNETIIDRLIYRIARNLIIDWYRRHALSVRAQEFFASCRREISDTTDQSVRLNEMLRIEQDCIRKMGSRKGDIYLLYIHQGKTSGEISRMLGLSKRTVENHIFAARNIVREGFRRAV